MPLALLALAIGGFGIGLTEFVIAGLLPDVAADLGVDEAAAGWLISGYALGVATALLGPKAAMACTVAVEEAIDEHYKSQENALAGTHEKDLAERIAKFRQDELRHRDIGYEHGAEQAPAYALLSKAIKAAAKAAIAVAKRL